MNIFWTKEKCQEEALKYKTKTDFRINCTQAYGSSIRNKWIYEVCSHMRKNKSYIWTKEFCQEESLNFASRNEFKNKSRYIYQISLKNGWINDICSHMIIIGDLYKRCIYVYEFSDNCAYIGLTSNLDRRFSEHLKKGAVYNHLQKNNIYNFKKLTEYIDVDLAKKLEEKYVNEYKKNGWIILNKYKTGSIGGQKFWTKEKCHTESLNYKTRGEFKNKSQSCYQISLRNKWLDDICVHMVKIRNSNGYWTKERCKEESLKYSTRWEFGKNCISGYSSSYKNKWLDEVCSHMIKN
jgi:predicted GIY-YIG superfamily endonuclease